MLGRDGMSLHCAWEGGPGVGGYSVLHGITYPDLSLTCFLFSNITYVFTGNSITNLFYITPRLLLQPWNCQIAPSLHPDSSPNAVPGSHAMKCDVDNIKDDACLQLPKRKKIHPHPPPPQHIQINRMQKRARERRK